MSNSVSVRHSERAATRRRIGIERPQEPVQRTQRLGAETMAVAA